MLALALSGSGHILIPVMTHEQNTWKYTAIKGYHKFLGLLKDTDPDIYAVWGAEKRLAGLRGVLELNVFIKPQFMLVVHRVNNMIVFLVDKLALHF